MQEIKVSDLKEGCFFTKPLFLDRKFILTSPELSVSHELIALLKQWGYKSVFSDGEMTQTAEYTKPQIPNDFNALTGDTVVQSTLSQKENDQREVSVQYYIQTLKFFSRIFRHFSQTGILNKQEITDKIMEMQQKYQDDKASFLHLPDIKTNNYLIVDSVKATFLALALVDTLKYPVHKQIEIGIATLLHDVGMFRIPAHLYLHDRVLTPQEIALLKEHVNIGVKAVKAGDFSQEVVQAIQEHHENFDGSGYPFKSAGQTISLYGRIVSLVCDYTAATSKRLFRNRKGSHFGIIDILQNSQKRYDPNIAKIFVLMLSLYPLGSFVQLVDGRKGVVVKTNIRDPKHPTVKIMIEGDGKPSATFPDVPTTDEGCAIERALTEEEVLSVKNIFRFNNLIDKSSPFFQ